MILRENYKIMLAAIAAHFSAWSGLRARVVSGLLMIDAVEKLDQLSRVLRFGDGLLTFRLAGFFWHTLFALHAHTS